MTKLNAWFKKRFDRFPSLRFQFVVVIMVGLMVASLSLFILMQVGSDVINRMTKQDIISYQSEIWAADELFRRAVEEEGANDVAFQRLLDELDVSERVEYELIYGNTNLTRSEFLEGMDFIVEQGIIVDSLYFSNEHGHFMLLIYSRKAINYEEILFISGIVLYIILFLSIFIFFVWQKERYLRHIAEDVTRLSTGDLSHRIPVKGRDEIAFVANNINHMSEKLEEQMAKERSSEQMKNELIANVSHDLRTPLTSVTGFLSLIKDNPDITPEEKERYIETALNKAMGLNRLVDELFEYVTLSNTTEAFDTIPMDMKVYLEQVLFEQQVMLEEKGFAFTHEKLHENAHCHIDPERLHRVFDNIFTNVVKHGSNEAPVQAKAFVAGDNLIVSVDNLMAEEAALGIPENVFNRYFTTDRNFNESGGLGLSIAKEIMLGHEGEISVTYKEHHFIITLKLPLEPPE